MLVPMTLGMCTWSEEKAAGSRRSFSTTSRARRSGRVVSRKMDGLIQSPLFFAWMDQTIWSLLDVKAGRPVGRVVRPLYGVTRNPGIWCRFSVPRRATVVREPELIVSVVPMPYRVARVVMSYQHYSKRRARSQPPPQVPIHERSPNTVGLEEY